MSVSNNKAKTHAQYTPLIYLRKRVQQRLYMEVKVKLIRKTQNITQNSHQKEHKGLWKTFQGNRKICVNFYKWIFVLKC